MSFQFFHRVSDGLEFLFVRVDFLRLRFDGVLERFLGGFLGGFDETFAQYELARLVVVEKRDFSFGFFRVFEAFLLSRRYSMSSSSSCREEEEEAIQSMSQH